MVAAVAGGQPVVVPRVEAGGEAGAGTGYGGSLMERDRLLGSMWGRRDWMAAHGVTVERTGVYTLQGVVSGGSAAGRDWGNLYTGTMVMRLDTEKADLWRGGFLTMRMQVSQGEAVTRRAGTVSPVNNAALLPFEGLAGRVFELRHLRGSPQPEVLEATAARNRTLSLVPVGGWVNGVRASGTAYLAATLAFTRSAIRFSSAPIEEQRTSLLAAVVAFFPVPSSVVWTTLPPASFGMMRDFTVSISW
jgi:hypothetical protein